MILISHCSRLPLPTTENDEEEAIYNVGDQLLHSLPVTRKHIANATKVHPVHFRVLQFSTVEVDEELKPYFNRRTELSVEQDCILLGLRVAILLKFQKELLSELQLALPGMVRMKKVAHSFVWWLNIDKDTQAVVGSVEIVNKSVAPLMPWVWPAIKVARSWVYEKHNCRANNQRAQRFVQQIWYILSNCE